MNTKTKILKSLILIQNDNTKLSPLYKFVHTLDEVLRERAVNNLDKQPF